MLTCFLSCLYSALSLTLVREQLFIILLCCSETRVQDALGQEYMLHQDKRARCTTRVQDVPGQERQMYRTKVQGVPEQERKTHSQARDSDLFRYNYCWVHNLRHASSSAKR